MWNVIGVAILCCLCAECLLWLQLKTQLTETLSKLEAEENERQNVAGDLYKVRVVFYIFLLLAWVQL